MLGGYARVHSCVYTENKAFTASSLYIISYCKAAAKRNCNEQMFSLEKIQRRLSLKDLLLDRTFAQPRHVDVTFQELLIFQQLYIFAITKAHRLSFDVSKTGYL